MNKKNLNYFIALLLVILITGCGSSGGGFTGITPDTTAPAINSTIPVNASAGVSINGSITSIFSEEMDSSTITNGTFILKQGGKSVTGTVSYAGTTATFNPNGDLTGNTVYTATITTGAKDIAGNALPVIKTWSFTTGAVADTTAPAINSTIPVNASTGVSINGSITSIFSELMDPLTINTGTFTLKQGATSIAGTVTYTGTTAIFNPNNNLTGGLVYTATITTGVKDLAGNALPVIKTWNFTTGATTDTTAPAVNSISPLSAATGVSINGSITATFSEPMDPLTVTTGTFTVKQGATNVAGTVTYAGKTATFSLNSDLASSTTYTATVTTGVKDLAGNALQVAKTWSFTTGATVDSTAPAIDSNAIEPLNGATGVVINSNLTVTFSEPMDLLTVTTGTYTLKQVLTSVTGTVTYTGTTAVFNPDNILAGNTTYTATVSTGVKDLAGNALPVAKTWTFTTGTVVAAGPAPVLIGTAGNYVILAKTAVSNVPVSSITGDIGLSPSATSFFTGFSLTKIGTTSATSTQVTGTLYGADMDTPTSSNLTTAVSNMETAYTDAAGRSTPDFLNLGTGELGGKTLVPGLYKWTTGVTMSSDVTLSGTSNDVWIFQIPGNLSMSAAKNIVLNGGAMSKNIFWQVAGEVTVGTGAHFEGIILSQTTIKFGTSASLNGRALAQTAVQLDKNTIVQPAQ